MVASGTTSGLTRPHPPTELGEQIQGEKNRKVEEHHITHYRLHRHLRSDPKDEARSGAAAAEQNLPGEGKVCG